MLKQLNAALTTLEEAIDGYVQACQEVYDHYAAGQPINTIPDDLAISLPHQLSRIQLLRERLRHTEIVVCRAMNASSSLVPIHALPSEILTRIFELVLQGNDCIDRHADESRVSPKANGNMLILAPVQVGNSMTSQIELAKLYAKRAGQAPLDVHISDRDDESSDHCDDGPPNHHVTCTSLAPLIASLAPRIRSFICHAFIPPETYVPVFSELLKNATPGALKALHFGEMATIESYYLDTDDESHENIISVKASNKHLEAIYRGIDVLRSSSIIPKWTSSAYHGLVELRLTRSAVPNFTESQLVLVLRRSPGLRILECEMRPNERSADV